MITSVGEILFDVYDNEKKLGGAPFNFIYHISKIMGNVNFISRIGNDILGREIINFLEKNKISIKLLQIDAENPTGTAVVTLNENKIPEFKITENSAYDFIELNENIIKTVHNSKVLYYGTLSQRNNLSRMTIQSLFNTNIKFFFDINLRQRYYSFEVIDKSLTAANIVKLNEEELKIIFSFFSTADYELFNSAEFIMRKYNLEILCITMGERGAYLFNQSNYSHYKYSVENIVDTTGAGDAYAAILLIGYLNNWNLERINETASKFAGEVCKIKGALPIDNNFYLQIVKEINNG